MLPPSTWTQSQSVKVRRGNRPRGLRYWFYAYWYGWDVTVLFWFYVWEKERSIPYRSWHADPANYKPTEGPAAEFLS